jgi:hypothetical protein
MNAPIERAIVNDACGAGRCVMLQLDASGSVAVGSPALAPPPSDVPPPADVPPLLDDPDVDVEGGGGGGGVVVGGLNTESIRGSASLNAKFQQLKL